MITYELLNRVFEQNGDFCKGEQWSCLTTAQRCTLIEGVIQVLGDLSCDHDKYWTITSEFYGECLIKGINPARQMHFPEMIKFGVEWFTDGMESAMHYVSSQMNDGQVPHEAL